MITKFPIEIQDFANQFVIMQKERHRADYDPDGVFSKDQAIQYIDEAEYYVGRFNQVAMKDRRAFAVYVLLNIRND